MPITHDYYGYKMTDDTGFAPCVTNTCLTLACCMTVVRKRAPLGTWIAGLGGVRFGIGKLIYLMQVAYDLDFDGYFRKAEMKGRPDNIYHWVNGAYQQIPSASRHTKAKEIEHDLSVDRVLVAKRFVYFGTNKIDITSRFRQFAPTARSYCTVDGGNVDGFVNWVFSHGSGIQGAPHTPLMPNSAILIQIKRSGRY